MRLRASDWPSVWGWKAVDILLFRILYAQTSLQKSDVMRESRSETTPLGVPKRHSTCSKNSSAKSAAEVSSRVGMNSAYFVNRSTTMRIALTRCPLRVCKYSGKPVIQSRLIALKGSITTFVGIGRGFNLPYGLCRWTAFPGTVDTLPHIPVHPR